MPNFGFLIEGRTLEPARGASPYEWAQGSNSLHKLEPQMSGPRCILDAELQFFANLWKIVFSEGILEPIGARGQRGVKIEPTDTQGLMSVVFSNLGTRIILAPTNISLEKLRSQFSIGPNNFDGIAINPIIF